MKHPLLFILFLLLMQSPVLFDFDKQTEASTWEVVDDVVMGGKSDGNFTINEAGHGVFSGTISLENNGGFSSVVHRMPPTKCSGFSGFKLRLKGDGSVYQFRVQSTASSRYSYSYAFETTGDWQIVEVPFSKMKAVYRGRDVDVPNYDGKPITEMRILIGNKKPQQFKLLLDQIELSEL